MSKTPNRRTRVIETVLLAMLSGTLLGSVLAFGGSVWWARPVLGALIVAMVVGQIIRVAVLGEIQVFRSPLSLLGAGAAALAVGQLAPLPGPLAGRLSPEARAWHVQGISANLAREDDPAFELGEPLPQVRSPATVDRSATARWLISALGTLAIFGIAAKLADRLARTLVIWGSVLAGFLLNTVFGVVQWLGDCWGLYGLLTIRSRRAWSPSLVDAWTSPMPTLLTAVGDDPSPWVVPVPQEGLGFGTILGSAPGYLALGSIGLPLALGITLHSLAPRGSRDPLVTRLRDTGRTSLVGLLAILLLASALLVGYLAGPWRSLPFAIGVLFVGGVSMAGAGVPRASVALTALTLLAISGGIALGIHPGRLENPATAALGESWARQVEPWRIAARIVQAYPIVGTGLGTLPTMSPLYKTRDANDAALWGSAPRWVAETGLVGLGLAGLAVVWCVYRQVVVFGKVGGADRALAAGLGASVLCFGLFSTVQATVEFPCVALGAGAVLGTWNRWLAGGTDLFVES